ncbi:uncharacterized protein LAESUDRAFT_716588 [Laetiporus sulphureus 93-53]|uniref:Uncharacterized protein n=1 Tax=Laetiporus sulphureus 93-53 TaxID=1314785 RepID=A0A165CH71_9APHY|nr:uncharacterized protein LAESUDRAFT_716588 [Laetiporus sulphureus 93-53]KZT02804.1 hypothetical protein LAESUDRAFT_716588 [Laetiporus sulphureus 93-53]
MPPIRSSEWTTATKAAQHTELRHCVRHTMSERKQSALKNVLSKPRKHPPPGEICNFTKTDPVQKKVDVYHVELHTTIEHLKAYYDSFDKHHHHIKGDDKELLIWLAVTLNRINMNLNSYMKEYMDEQWKRLNWRLQVIGKVKFTGLQANYLTISHQLAEII